MKNPTWPTWHWDRHHSRRLKHRDCQRPSKQLVVLFAFRVNNYSFSRLCPSGSGTEEISAAAEIKFSILIGRRSITDITEITELLRNSMEYKERDDSTNIYRKMNARIWLVDKITEIADNSVDSVVLVILLGDSARHSQCLGDPGGIRRWGRWSWRIVPETTESTEITWSITRCTGLTRWSPVSDLGVSFGEDGTVYIQIMRIWLHCSKAS